MRRTLGTAVFSGMLGVTLFGIFLTPVFFFTVNWASESRLFAARSIQLAGRFLLDLFTLGVWRIVAMFFRSPFPLREGGRGVRLGPPKTSPPAPPRSGDGSKTFPREPVERK
jgi:hypothetical protein